VGDTQITRYGPKPQFRDILWTEKFFLRRGAPSPEPAGDSADSLIKADRMSAVWEIQDG
jgi:hypothetical protein